MKNGGIRSDKWIHIDTEIFDRFAEARDCYKQVSLFVYLIKEKETKVDKFGSMYNTVVFDFNR